jgi:hypothetical protein
MYSPIDTRDLISVMHFLLTLKHVRPPMTQHERLHFKFLGPIQIQNCVLIQFLQAVLHEYYNALSLNHYTIQGVLVLSDRYFPKNITYTEIA